MKAAGLEPLFRERTGLVLDPYFSGAKLAWILDTVPGARGRAERGELAFGTVDSWVVWNLTGGERHVTNASNASRTLLYNIHRGEWDSDLLAAMEEDTNTALPELRVDGGATSNNLLMQFQADLLGVPVVWPKETETTALGAAFLAGLAVGFWLDRSKVGGIRQSERTFIPSMDRARADEMRSRWSRALERAKGWERP